MPPSPLLPAHQQQPSRHLRLRRVACALLGLMALDGLAWQSAQRSLDRMTARWSARLHQQGWTVQPGQTVRGGSPLTARITLRNPRLDGPAGDRTITWGAESITLSLSLLHPLTIRIGLDGSQAVRVTGSDTTTLAARFQAEDARIFVPFGLPSDAATGRATWAARSLSFQIIQQDGHTTDLTLRTLRGHGVWNNQAGPDASRMALTTHATTVDLPPTWPLPATPTDAHHLSDAGLTLSFPGGTEIPLLVQDLHAQWTHLSLSMVGNAHIAATGGPEGAFTLSIAGIGQTVHTLDQAGILSPDLARAVTAIDRLAAGYSGTTVAPEAPSLTNHALSLPLRLNAGMLFIGTLNLGRPADWFR